MTSGTNKKRRNRKDWHPADIKAAMAKKGYTFARLAREYGYVLNAPNTVLHKPWAVIEQIVGDIIGRHPSNIWPSRYDQSRRPLRADLKSFCRLRTKTEHNRDKVA